MEGTWEGVKMVTFWTERFDGMGEVLPWYYMALGEVFVGKKIAKQRKTRQLLALEKKFTRKLV